MPEPIPPLEVGADELLKLYVARDWERLSTRFLSLLQHFEEHTYAGLTAAVQEQVDQFVKSFLFIFTQADFVIPVPHRLLYLQLNPVLSNVVAMSSMKTTDPWLAIVARQPDNLLKILTLYSARNETRLDRARLFAINPQAASLWYGVFTRSFPTALVEENAFQHLREHVNALPGAWQVLDTNADAFFACTYIDEDADPRFKAHINRSIRQTLQGVTLRNRANPRRIAVASAYWYPEHSACRIQYEFVASLAADYELVLVQLGPPRPQVDTRLFSEVVEVKAPTLEALKVLDDNTFRMVYFPDIGMNVESILLANLRVAPIQVTTYGHPVSTFGGEVDYFIGSETIEENVSNLYSERPVLLPGLGVVHNRPKFDTSPVRAAETGRVVINCSWYAQKVNARLVRALQQIVARAGPPVLFRFFPGGSLSQRNHLVPFVRTLEKALGAGHVQVIPFADYSTYMAMLAQGTFALDSFHFGGSNVVVDNLHVRKLILCREGARWYNRIGPAMLRHLGLGELVADSDDVYIEKAVRLINDKAYRLSLQDTLDLVDLDERLYSKREVPHFKAAIDYLMANHEQLVAEGRRDPILVRDILTQSSSQERAGGLTR